MITGNNNCYDLILNCSYTKQNEQTYCEIIIVDFASYDVAKEYFNENFNNKTCIAYLYKTVNHIQCTIDPVYENEKITQFGLTLIILGFIVLFAYVYITRKVFSQMFTVKKYKSIDYQSIDNDDPPKYSINE
jgi:hypothetical protein